VSRLDGDLRHKPHLLFTWLMESALPTIAVLLLRAFRS